MARKKINESNESKVLIESRRRCAICFGLNNDFTIKRGQIAHIDQNSSNSNIENLVFLCLEHHDLYDSKTSQSKNFKPKELKEYKKLLLDYIAQWELEKSKRIYEERSGNNDRFTIYRLVNSGSEYGYEYIALNETRNFSISISERLLCIDSIYSEIFRLLNCDYEKTHMQIDFPLNELSSFIKNQLFEEDYSLIANWDEKNQVERIDLTFNTGNKCYEINFSLTSGQLTKTADGYEKIIGPIDTDHPDITTFKRISSFVNVLGLRVEQF